MSESTQGEIILYPREDGSPALQVRLENETVWLSQAQMADLFGTSKQNISHHINAIFNEGELTQAATVKKYLTVQTEGNREIRRNLEYYNLDMIISLGYRVKSSIATQFRIWATQRLREYIVKGFALDDERLKGNASGDYWKELLERIRDIRSSEKALYRQVLDLYATSRDYSSSAAESVRFFKIVQNKLHYAASGQTAAEIRAKEHHSMYMKDWLEELDKFAGMYGKGALQDAGKRSHQEAEEKAMQEYHRYQARTLSPVEQDYLDTIRILEKRAEKKVKNDN